MKLRLVLLLLGLAAAWVGLVALVNYHTAVMVHLSQLTGTSNSASRSYNFFSGFGSDIGELALVGGIATVVRSRNCHQKGCWRIGIHTTSKGHKLCKKHIGQSADALNVHPVHEDHL